MRWAFDSINIQSKLVNCIDCYYENASSEEKVRGVKDYRGSRDKQRQANKFS